MSQVGGGDSELYFSGPKGWLSYCSVLRGPYSERPTEFTKGSVGLFGVQISVRHSAFPLATEDKNVQRLKGNFETAKPNHMVLQARKVRVSSQVWGGESTVTCP